MGRPHEAGLLQPRGSLVTFALGHHAPHGRDDSAGGRLEQRVVADAADRGQQRCDHRAQLRRARRREQRTVRDRSGDRLLRTLRESVRLPGRLRLSLGDGDRSREHRPDRECEERGNRQEVHRVHPLAGRSGAVARSEDPPASGAPVRVLESTQGLSESVLGQDQSQGQFRFGRLRSALLRGERDLRPDHHLPPQRPGRCDEGDTRRDCEARGQEQSAGAEAPRRSA